MTWSLRLPSAFLALGVLVIVGRGGQCDAQSPHGQRSERAAELVEALASANRPPKLVGEKDPRPPDPLPPDYRIEAQDRVYVAYSEILKAGVDAFPELIEHLDDKRYSATEDDGACWVNWTVGDMCRFLIADQLEVYRDYVRDDPQTGRIASYVSSLVGTSKAEAQAWWSRNRTKKLYELQAAALGWAIDKERDYGFRDLRKEASVLGPMAYLAEHMVKDKHSLGTYSSRPLSRLSSSVVSQSKK